jgi:hypothetical protein
LKPLFLLSLFEPLLVDQRLSLSNSVEVISQAFPNLLFPLALRLFGKADFSTDGLLLLLKLFQIRLCALHFQLEDSLHFLEFFLLF